MRWPDYEKATYRASSWLRPRLRGWRPTRRLADWLDTRFLQDEAGLFVFDREGRLHWKLPVHTGRTHGAAFLADGRICWSDGDEIRVGDPNAAARERR